MRSFLCRSQEINHKHKAGKTLVTLKCIIVFLLQKVRVARRVFVKYTHLFIVSNGIKNVVFFVFIKRNIYKAQANNNLGKLKLH